MFFSFQLLYDLENYYLIQTCARTKNQTNKQNDISVFFDVSITKQFCITFNTFTA